VRHAAVLRESRRPGPFPGRAASPFPVFFGESSRKDWLGCKSEGALPRYLLPLVGAKQDREAGSVRIRLGGVPQDPLIISLR